MASNRSKMNKPAKALADAINLQSQQVDAQDNGTKTTQLVKTSKPVEATSISTAPSKLPTTDQLTLESTNWLGSVKAQCSLTNDETSAQFHPDRSGYLLAPEIIAQKEFSIKRARVTIEHGEFKGHQALVLVPVPKKTFDFFGLPPEIRIMIYKLLLTKPGHVVTIQGGKTRRIHGGFYPDDKRWITPNSYRTRFTTLPIATKIFQASHQVHDEATAILYGANNFRIIAADTSCGFLKCIGTNNSLVQNIEIWAEQNNNYFRRRVSKVIKYLPEAKHLKRLELRLFGSFYTTKWGNGSDLFEALKPLLNTLYDREKDVEKVIEVMEFHAYQLRCPLHIPHVNAEDPCTIRWCEESRAMFKSIVTDIEASTRNYLNFSPKRRNTGRPKRTTARDIDYSEQGDS